MSTSGSSTTVSRWQPPSFAATADGAAAAAIVLILGFNSSDVRPSFRRDPRAAYADSAMLVLRCVLSLRRVNTTLPVVLLVSGERDAAFEALLANDPQLGVRIEPVASWATLRPPPWSSPWMRGTFAKFSALSLSQYRRVIVLDSDTLVVKNVDHLSNAPPPIAGYFHFEFGYTCPQQDVEQALVQSAAYCDQGILNSGVLALQPDPSRLETARKLLFAGDGSTLGDAGGLWETSDQRLWHALYARETIYELPFGYNANADANLTRASWADVSILHDLVVQRKRGWARSGHAELVESLTREARHRFSRAREIKK